MKTPQFLITVAGAVIFTAIQAPTQAQAQSIEQQLRSRYRIASVGADGGLRDATILVVAQERIKAHANTYWYNSHHPGKGISYSALFESTQTPEVRSQAVFLNLGFKVIVKQLDIRPSDVKLCVETAPNPNNPAYFACVLFQFPTKGFVVSANWNAIQDSINEIFVIDSSPSKPSSLPERIGSYSMPNTANVMQLNADGTFSVTQSGQKHSGNFTIEGDSLLIRVGDRSVATGTFQGNTIANANGSKWVKNVAVVQLKFPSIYVNAQAPSDRLQLNGDNSCALQEGGQTYRGTFVANGNNLEITIPETNAKTTMTIGTTGLTDPSGLAWTLQEQSGPSAPTGPILQNEDIVKLAKVGIDDATIIAKIESSKCQFDTSTDALVELKKSGVSAAVLRTMVGAIIRKANPAPLKFPSTYVNAQTPGDRLQLNGDNSCSLQESGQTYRGTFVANGNSLEITITETNAKTAMTIGANTLTDPSGFAWTLQEQSGPTASSEPALRKEDIVESTNLGIDSSASTSVGSKSGVPFLARPDGSIDPMKTEEGVIRFAGAGRRAVDLNGVKADMRFSQGARGLLMGALANARGYSYFKIYVFEVNGKKGTRTAIINKTSMEYRTEPFGTDGQYVCVIPERELPPGEYAIGASNPRVPNGGGPISVFPFGVDPK